ncbi:hypothetical protein G6R40_12645 [Chryseobacterium sp. POL2]|uniref:hypothetical protein n=1 Tax=Chryseobacterium sp. POL2 TaxID=2713414 RepID=UPI0013E20126|nr:hypothetical protein [Chryseobacterium sp. POL2]QIG90448.1 hypothetical protein G6R40_12645 [Chryseobacterium sp. POL2]
MGIFLILRIKSSTKLLNDLMISYNSKFKILIFINLGLLMFGQKMPRPAEVVANYYKALGGKEDLR